ncbi:ABC transporter permease [Helicobacter sp. faydin-H20]|uniref:ABC transporter permease n=1 Tax=Helicobacter anatolicus TaxID=2905874 RepID=UPI001E3D9024|nr:ABC transporter permease [Helicobacter anatolicus]MCE3037227.1 ABC transporter permease [Helicobacter anatolicus]
MSFFKIFALEFKAIFSNSTILLIVFGGSLMYVLLYPTPYKSDLIRDQKIAVVDLDQSMQSKELIFYVNSMPQNQVTQILDSEHQALESLTHNKIFGYLIIPKGFEKNLKKGVPAHLAYIANASYFSAYGAIVEGLNDAANALGQQIIIQTKILQNSTIHQKADLLQKTSIPLFNPSNGYLNYALAAILIFILHQTAIGGTMLLGAFQNKENNPVSYYRTQSFFKILFARLLIFGGIYILLFLLFFGFFFTLYDINIKANIVDFWCFALVFIFAMLSLGIFLGLFIKNTALPTQIVLISSLPIVFLLGFIWPSELIPDFLKSISALIPAYHGINGFLKLNQMSASLNQIMPQFFYLLFLGCFYSFCAIFYHSFYIKNKNLQ